MSAQPATACGFEDSNAVGLLPATAPEPARIDRVRFPKALLLAWLMPRRYGPSLAAGTTRRAVVAHLAAALMAFTVVGITRLVALGPEAISPHQIRLRLAEAVLLMAGASSGSPLSWLAALMYLGFIPVVELALLALATLAMPWCAAGDSAVSVWKRSVRLIFWATTIVIPASLFVPLATLAEPDLTHSDPLAFAISIGLFAYPVVLIMFFIRMLLVGGYAYAGPPDGPAFAPREPLCDDCGYCLLGLPEDARCPECGTPARESLPGGRRGAVAWAQRIRTPRGLVELARAHLAVLRGTSFFRRLAVQNQMRNARVFWWLSYIVMTLVVLAATRVVVNVLPMDVEVLEIGHVGILLMAGVFGLHSALMLPACLWSQFRYGIRDYRISAAVCCHCLPLWWPVIALVLALAVLMTEPAKSWIEHSWFQLQLGSVHLGGAEAASLTLSVLIVAAIVFTWVRTCRAMRAVRFANV